MDTLTITVILTFSLLFLIIGFAFFSKYINNKSKSSINKISSIISEDKYGAIDELRRIIKNNPKDFKTREKLADLLFETKSYLSSIKEYLALIDYSSSNPDLDELKLTIKIASGYQNLENFDEAKKYYLMAKKIDDLNFDVNLNLGKIEVKNKAYEKAHNYLKNAIRVNPDNKEVMKTYGICLYYLNQFGECLTNLIKVDNIDPNDPEVIYYLSYATYNITKNEESAKYFTRLKKIAQYEVESIFMLGIIHKKQNLYTQAIEELEYIISTNKLKIERLTEAYYILADCYANSHNIQKTLFNLQKIMNINSDYKDVAQKIEKFSQINQSSLYEKYLMGSANQFTSICKLFIKFYIPKYSQLKGNIKFLNVQQEQDGSIEFFIEVSNKNFVEQLYFSFNRTTNTLGDMIMRVLYNKLREQKIDRAVCVSAGLFTEQAKSFVESRMIELVEKDRLISILNEIGKILSEST